MSKFIVNHYLQDPGTIAGEGVAGVDDVSVPGEATQQIPYALDEGVDLRMDQDLRDEILARILDQPFTYREEKKEKLW